MSVDALGKRQRSIMQLADAAANGRQQEPAHQNQCDNAYGDDYTNHLWPRE
jgi:hypothetical protein